MKGLDYKSQLIYSFCKSNEEIKRILEFDGFKDYKIDGDQKIVEYTIDHSKSIQLSLLIYLLEINLIRLTIAQQIQLCLNIYDKYKQLEQQNIQHNYLSSNRIWLNIYDRQYQITILPVELKYTIHFVGYDCPFYETNNYLNSQIKDDQAIKQIIISILQNTKKMVLKNPMANTQDKQQLEKQKLKNEKFPNLELIFNVLLNEGIYKSFEQFIEASKLVFQKYGSKDNNQRLSGVVDKQLTKINSKRARRVNDIIKNLELIRQQYYKNDQSYQFQQRLYQTFPIIAKELKQASIYEYQLPNITTDNYVFDLIENIDKSKQTMDQIDQVINEIKEIIMKNFKFELDLDSIKKDISTLLTNKFKIMKYFLNDIKYGQSKIIKTNNDVSINFNQKLINNNEQNLNTESKIVYSIESQINKLKDEIIKDVVTQTLQEYLELQILKLIDDLI